MTTPSRQYDLVLFGATGITGRGIAEYIVDRLESVKVNWAIAGRSEDRLRKVKEDLGDKAKDIGILIADSSDFNSLVTVCKQTRVIISAVGPFARYGVPLVKACVQEKTHYVDTTGEPQFMRSIADQFHDEAKGNGTFIIPATGYDCVPSDIAAYMLVKHFRDIGYANVGYEF
jgi:short subunit dehydrogenase-like uncharacterized protein